jgi:uncharacterized protein (DUF433 family)
VNNTFVPSARLITPNNTDASCSAPVDTISVVSVCYNNWYMKEDQRLYRERIVTDPRILAGKPVVKGTRIAVDLVLEELSHNPDIGELLAAHPDLSRTDVQACLAYAQALVTGEEVSPKPPKGGRADAAL